MNGNCGGGGRKMNRRRRIKSGPNCRTTAISRRGRPGRNLGRKSLAVPGEKSEGGREKKGITSNTPNLGSGHRKMDEGLVSCDGGFIPSIWSGLLFFSIGKSHHLAWMECQNSAAESLGYLKIAMHKITKVDDFISCDRRRRT